MELTLEQKLVRMKQAINELKGMTINDKLLAKIDELDWMVSIIAADIFGIKEKNGD
jgi:hypothetical protein